MVNSVLASHLSRPGAPVRLGGTLHLYWPEDRWDSGMLQRLRTALGALGSAPEAKDIIVTVVPDRDWNLIWTRSIEPIRVGRRILIRQSWNAARPAPGDIELVIDPKRAFGTGFHATTQLLLAWLEDKIFGGEKDPRSASTMTRSRSNAPLSTPPTTALGPSWS